MLGEATIGELLELGIAAENTCQELYQGFEKLFAHQPEVARFWARYAADEAGHAKELEKIRNLATPEQLSAPADPSLIQKIHDYLHPPAAER